MFGGFNPFDFSGFGSDGLTGVGPDFSIADQPMGQQMQGPMPEQIADFMATKGIRPGDFMRDPNRAFDGAGVGAVPFAGTPNPRTQLGSLLGGTEQQGVLPQSVQPTPVRTTSYTPGAPGSIQQTAAISDAVAGGPVPPAQTPATTEVSAKAGPDAKAEKSQTDKFVESLKGLKAPETPKPQTVYTPHALAPAHAASIKGGNIAALLQLLGAQGGGQNLGTKIPLSLGSVLGR